MVQPDNPQMTIWSVCLADWITKATDTFLINRIIRNYCRGFNNLSVWNELDYRVDVCIITNGAHIEHL